MLQLQDALGLGREGRMNQPGTTGGWGWRLDEIPFRGRRRAPARRYRRGGAGLA